MYLSDKLKLMYRGIKDGMTAQKISDGINLLLKKENYLILKKLVCFL